MSQLIPMSWFTLKLNHSISTKSTQWIILDKSRNVHSESQ